MDDPAFIAIQHAFTRHLRDPDRAPVPDGIDPDRMAVYSNAVYANIEGFMGDNFPIVKSLYEDGAWHAMVREYISEFDSSTPLFVELPGEFLRFLEEVRDDSSDPPFLYELAHFELLENVVSTVESRVADVRCDPDGDVIAHVPIINPTVSLVSYSFPVHTLSADNAPNEPPAQPTYIVAFRDRGNRFGYIDLNATTARAVELLLGDEPLSGEQILRRIAEEINHPDVDAVIAGGREIFARLLERDVILGTAT